MANRSYTHCFSCGEKLEVRNGQKYCSSLATGESVSQFDVRGCYYTWNTHPSNGGRTLEQTLGRIKKKETD